MSEFRVGEIAINVRPGSPNYGREVTILSPLKQMTIWDGGACRGTHWVYEVDAPFAGAAPHGSWSALPSDLRKRPPPQDWVKLCNLNDVPQEVVSHV